MKATLTIEVPDDWSKGCKIKCPLHVGHCPANVTFGVKGMCNAENCPLEIKENTDE